MSDLFGNHGVYVVIVIDFLSLLNQRNDDHGQANQKHHGQNDNGFVIGLLQHEILLSSPGRHKKYGSSPLPALLLFSLPLQVVLQELDDDLFDLLDRIRLGEILFQRIMAERDGIP